LTLLTALLFSTEQKLITRSSEAMFWSGTIRMRVGLTKGLGHLQNSPIYYKITFKPSQVTMRVTFMLGTWSTKRLTGPERETIMS
jgi:hypothetical protein